ncbi:hypothetical protein PIB30_049480 [Stylosanthes scabra]|uniref:Uncharacterized protein n=1 Tax=Stylosanthes scabra TaxID=79078 RepID=A0ABU6QHI9_9FABA|nr:hypothetical protein [Stylosanthes scabra]
MSRRIRSIPCDSNGNFNEEGTWFVLYEEARDEYFREMLLWAECGAAITMDCKYFAWVDEIDGGWEGLSQVLIGRTSEKPNGRTGTEDTDAGQLGATREIDLQIMKKKMKIHGGIKTVRMWVGCHCFLIVELFRVEYIAIDEDVEVRVGRFLVVFTFKIRVFIE